MTSEPTQADEAEQNKPDVKEAQAARKTRPATRYSDAVIANKLRGEEAERRSADQAPEDEVTESSEESFPASDSPSWTPERT